MWYSGARAVGVPGEPVEYLLQIATSLSHLNYNIQVLTFAPLPAASFYGATRSFHTPSSPLLHVCLAFTATHGILLIAPVSIHGTPLTAAASNQSHSLALVLSNGSLTTLLVDSQQRVVESIPLSIHLSPQSWLELELSISGDNLTLQLQETTISTTLYYSLNFTGEIHLGGDPSSNLTSENLVGCISNVAINSQAVEFSASTEGGYNQGCCVPPRRLPPGGLGVEANSLWGDISIEAREAVVDEGTNITISDMNLLITIPSDLVSYDMGYWHHSDLVNSVVFDVVGQPSSGYLVRGNEEHISRFFYHELQSSNPLSQVSVCVYCAKSHFLIALFVVVGKFFILFLFVSSRLCIAMVVHWELLTQQF